MISHKHKCIFIHITKCAGTSIENAFGVDTKNHNAEENNNLFGWHKDKKLWLQHATPQTLIDLEFISRNHWESYYKFIVYRNSWDRSYSDYKWMRKVRKINDTFENYITKSGQFHEILRNDQSKFYAGDHLNLQKDYFYLDGKRINFDREINFEYLDKGFTLIEKDLGLPDYFFDKKLNTTKTIGEKHYSIFFNRKRRKLVKNRYLKDIEFFNFIFEDKRPLYKKIGL